MAAGSLQLKITATDLATKPLGSVAQALHNLAGAALSPAKALGGVVEGFGKLGLAGLGVGATVGAVKGLADALRGPVDDASDLAESTSKVGVVFGAVADSVKAFASTSAQSLGLPKQAAMEMAGTFGNLFVAMGVGQGEAADLSKNILTLGADLASFNNIPVTDALEKLRAGLTGESEPLKALGVNMNEAAVKAKALELGLVGANGELSEAAKVQARYAVIMEQTKTAQGDFARTSTGMANASRIIGASMADLRAKIGEQVLPVVAPLISSFAQGLPRAFDVAIPLVEKAGGMFQGLAGNALASLGGLGRITDLIGKFIAYLGPDNDFDLMGSLFGDAGPRIDEVTRAVKAAVGTIGEAIGQLAGLVSQGPGAVFDALAASLSAFAPTGERIGKVMGAIGEAIAALIPSPLVDLVNGFTSMATEATAGAAPMQVLADVVNGLSGALEGAVTWLRENKLAQAALVGGVTAAATAWTLATAATIAHTVATKAQAIATGLATTAQTALNLVLTANPIGLVVVALAGLTAGLLYAYNNSEDFRRIVDDLWGAVSGFARGLWDTVVPAVQGFIDAVGKALKWVQDLIGAIKQLPSRLVAPTTEPPPAGAGLASGTASWRGGLAVVGERGPELVNLPPGAQVIPAQETARLMGQLVKVTAEPLLAVKNMLRSGLAPSLTATPLVTTSTFEMPNQAAEADAGRVLPFVRESMGAAPGAPVWYDSGRGNGGGFTINGGLSIYVTGVQSANLAREVEQGLLRAARSMGVV